MTDWNEQSVAAVAERLSVERLSEIVANTSADLRELDYELRQLGSARPETRDRGRKIVDRIHAREAVLREARARLHNHPDYRIEGL